MPPQSLTDRDASRWLAQLYRKAGSSAVSGLALLLLGWAPLFAQQRRRLFVALVLSLVTLATGIGLLGLSGWFLTAAAVTTAGSAFNLFGPSAGAHGLAFISVLSRYGEKLAGHDATLRLPSTIRAWLFGRLFPILPLRSKTLGRPDLVSRLTGDVDALYTAFPLAIGPITTAALTGIAMGLGLWAVLPGASLAFVGSFFLGLDAVLGLQAGALLPVRKSLSPEMF